MISATKSAITQALLYIDGKPVSFEHYPFMTGVYDGEYPSLLLITGRQVSKTIAIDEQVSLANGRQVPGSMIRTGDRVLSLDPTTQRIVPNKITWVSEHYVKPTLRITTRQGHCLVVAPTHPLRVWDDWRPAGECRVGDRVAVVRKGGVFTGISRPSRARIALTAYLLGDGYLSETDLTFTSLPGPKLDEFLNLLDGLGNGYHLNPKSGTDAVAVRLHRSIVRQWLQEDGLLGHRSGTKFIPSWVFDLSRDNTALFLNRLWSTDGHVVKNTTNYNIGYCSISPQLSQGVQALLWKFGIPTKLVKRPARLKSNPDYKKDAYILRVETATGVARFLTEVGVIEKSESIPLPTAKQNNNRDTLPREANETIKRAYGARRWNNATDALYQKGLRLTPKYPLTYPKLAEYIHYLRAIPTCDQGEVDKLEAVLGGDVYWDEIVAMEPLAEQTCIDFEVERTHNFVVGGVITHNSTSACNFIISESIAKPFWRTLFVAPSREQTSKFSATRLGKTLAYSPLVRKRFSGHDDTNNVFLKVLKNGSEIALSYASDDPDRIRGISADRVILDEVQDMDLAAVRPVVMECAANSNFGYQLYAGTPKSLENGIQDLWERSCQNEWITKCDGCGKHNFINSEKSIGLKGPICLNCGHLLNPRYGQWYSMKPGQRIAGFHISQPMLPLNCEMPQRWDRILDKLETYPPQKFKNEVLGISDAIGTRMISKQELCELCDESNIFNENPGPQPYPTIAGGVDWSGGGQSSSGQEIVSRTVAWVWALQADNKLRCLYYKVFPGRNQVEDVREVATIFQKFRVQLVCGDAGEGAVANSMLKEILGEHRVFQLQYGSTAKQIIWNGKDRFMIDRTAFIDSYMLLLKRKGVVFGPARVMNQAINDILAEYEEVTQSGMGKKVWRHSPSIPDDSLHAGIFAWTALRLARGELQLYRNEGNQVNTRR